MTKAADAEMVKALREIAVGLHAIADSIHKLGNADAATPMGALELFGKTLSDSVSFAGISIAAEIKRSARVKVEDHE